MPDSDLVGLDGEPLRQKNVKRRRQTADMKKETPKGSILYRLIVDAPKEISEDEWNRYVYEYFCIGAEAFKGKLR